jgi:hypothetical protein
LKRRRCGCAAVVTGQTADAPKVRTGANERMLVSGCDRLGRRHRRDSTRAKIQFQNGRIRIIKYLRQLGTDIWRGH